MLLIKYQNQISIISFRTFWVKFFFQFDSKYNNNFIIELLISNYYIILRTHTIL